MTKIRVFKVKGKNYKRSSKIKVKQLTDQMKNLSDKKIKKHYTTSAEGYQLKVVWKYQCKKDYPKWHSSIGASFKAKKDNEYITKIRQLPLEKMLKEADSMAWLNYVCSPLTEYRFSIMLEHYLPIKESSVNKLVKTHRLKKENIREYEHLLNKVNIDESYKFNKDLANRDKRNFISKDDFYTLRKIIRNEKLTKEEEKRADRVKKENWNYIELYKKVKGYKK